jgi:NitT/TauT family transport system substrate-binding protein
MNASRSCWITGESHQTWQLNEINKLIWPSPEGIGIMDPELWEQTVSVALEGEVITEEPSEEAYRTDLAQAALDELAEEYPDLDLTGEDFEPVEVELREGGE